MRRFSVFVFVALLNVVAAAAPAADPAKKAEPTKIKPATKSEPTTRPEPAKNPEPVKKVEPQSAAEPAAAAKAPVPSAAADPFDARSLAGWTTQDGKPVVAGWEVVDGAIHLNKASKQRGGNIVTVNEYADFDLSFEWKIAPKGNSGIKYRVRSYGGRTLGCEYQIYDDVGTKTSPKSKNSSGSLYDLYEPNDKKKLKPTGEFNTGRIVVKGQHVEHWLNGEKIVSVEIGDAEWKRRVAASKFDDAPEFALEPGGKLMLTDHGSEVWYRNFKFVAVPVPPKPRVVPVRETFVYKTVGPLKIQADVERLPAGSAKRPRPVVVWIHGGALINGHRESVPQWMRDAFVPRGYAVVSLDYRLAPETKLPEIVADVEDAIAWVRRDGPKLFEADPKRIAVLGGSAGGYLALVAGQRTAPQAVVSLWGYGDLGASWTYEASKHPRHTTAKFAEEDVSLVQAGPAVADSRARKADGSGYYQYQRRTGGWAAAVSGWNPQREAKKFTPYMPERNVTSDYPPTFLVHGDADTDVPFACSQRFADQLKKHQVEHRLYRVAGAEHGLSGADPSKVTLAYETAAAFVIKHLEGR